jgi:hypothetical protein
MRPNKEQRWLKNILGIVATNGLNRLSKAASWFTVTAPGWVEPR